MARFTNKNDTRHFAIVHPEAGIFVGEAMGLCFFSLLDTAGQTRIATFSTEAEAHEFAQASIPANESYTIHRVRSGHWRDLLEAGLPIGDMAHNEAYHTNPGQAAGGPAELLH